MQMLFSHQKSKNNLNPHLKNEKNHQIIFRNNQVKEKAMKKIKDPKEIIKQLGQSRKQTKS